MSTSVTSKTFHLVKKNGKVIKKSMLDATFDGKNAIIDTLDNNVAHRFELSGKDMKNLLKEFIVSNKKKININALNDSSSIKEHLLSINEKNKSKSHNILKKRRKPTRRRPSRRKPTRRRPSRRKPTRRRPSRRVKR